MGDPVDWAYWPLLHARAGDIPAGEVSVVLAQALGEALERHAAFAAVVQTPGSARRGDRRAAGQVRMVRRLRSGLSARCRGLGFVMPPAALRDNAKAIRSGPKIWGCATTAADDPVRARAWARDRLAVGESC